MFCKYACLNACMHVYVCNPVYVSMCLHARMYMYLYVHMHITCICVVCIYIYIYVLMCIHMFIRTTTHINLYQQMNSFLLTPTPLSGKLERRSVVETYLCSLP